MVKFIYVFILIISINLYGNVKNIEKKIDSNKKILIKKKQQNKYTKQKIQRLADAINVEDKILNDIQYNLNKVSNNIFLNKLKLSRAKREIIRLSKETKKLKKYTTNIEEKIVNSIIEKYSITLGKDLINKQSLDGIIQKEKYDLILDNTKDTIIKSNLQYFKLTNDKARNDKKRSNLEQYIANQEQEKKRYTKLKVKQRKSLESLKFKHNIYQRELKAIINKQEKISDLLGKLNILKTKKLKAEKLAKIKEKKRLARIKAEKLKKLKLEKELIAKKNKSKQIKMKSSNKIITKSDKSSKSIKMVSKKELQKDIDLTVRNIGSTTKGIKTSTYKGKKTIAPLKSYKIIKKFGKFYDPVYKIKLFNESISLKSKKPNAKVYSVLKGKVVYAKHDAGELGNVVIVKHNNGLHTIYSQLSDIPKTLRVGQWIKKGYVVGRVKDVLVFQATRNNKYLNPEKLFK